MVPRSRDATVLEPLHEKPPRVWSGGLREAVSESDGGAKGELGFRNSLKQFETARNSSKQFEAV